MRKRGSFIGVLLITLVIVGIVTAAKTVSADPQQQSSASAPGSGPCTSIADYSTNAQGGRLRATKMQLKAEKDKVDPEGRMKMANEGDWAYSSLPLDVGVAGAYVAKFGPLPPSFDWPTKVSRPEEIRGAGLNFPPDFRGDIMFSGAPTITSRGGERFLEVPITIDRNPRPCTQLVLWIY